MAKPITTGIVYRGNELDFTSVRDGAVMRRSTADKAVLAETQEDETGIGDSSTLYEALGREQARLKGHLHYAIKAGRALIRVVDLPSDDPEELEGMAELQVDKLTPFPVEHMYIGTEILDQQEGATRMLITAIQKKFVDHAGDSFKEAGLVLKRVDVDVLAWLHLLRKEDRLPPGGRHMLFFLEETGTELVIIEDGQPLWFRSLGRQGEESIEEFMEDIAEEADYTLTALEGEWGSDPIQSVTVWHRGARPQHVNLLGEATGHEVRTQNLEELPPLSEGVALRADQLDDGMDLAPLEWAEEQAARKMRLRLITIASSVLACWLGLVVGFNAYQNSVEKKKRMLAARLAEYKEPVERIIALEKSIADLRAFNDRQYSGLEALAIVAEKMPHPVELTSFKYTKEKAVVVDGVSGDRSKIYEFQDLLSKTEDLFTLVDQNGRVSAVSSGRHRGKEKFTFDCFLPNPNGDEEGEEELEDDG